jgi:hypothetical protein
VLKASVSQAGRSDLLRQRGDDEPAAGLEQVCWDTVLFASRAWTGNRSWRCALGSGDYGVLPAAARGQDCRCLGCPPPRCRRSKAPTPGTSSHATGAHRAQQRRCGGLERHRGPSCGDLHLRQAFSPPDGLSEAQYLTPWPQGSTASAEGPGRALYLAGLKAMLAEMRARRPPDTPFGHTQQLQAHFHPSARVTKVCRGLLGGCALLAQPAKRGGCVRVAGLPCGQQKTPSRNNIQSAPWAVRPRRLSAWP